MKKIVYINCCIRGNDSRTLKIAQPIIQDIRKYAEVVEINLAELDLKPYNKALYSEKANGYIEQRYIEYSKLVADSDGLIIAAPFWDMSFPSQLKTFLEGISLFDVMFISDDKQCIGIAKCPFMLLITTRGMNIPQGNELEQATPYLKALCWLWGIKDFQCVDAYNFDYLSEDEIANAIKEAVANGINTARKLIQK